MAAPHVVQLSKVGFNSITRTVSNLSLNVAGIDVFDDTATYPMAGLEAPVAAGTPGRISFTTRMNPSGSSGGAKTPPDGPLLQACGFTENINGTTDTTYNLTDPPVYVAEDISAVIGAGSGLKQDVDSAIGSCVIRYEPARTAMIDWSFGGVSAAPTEAAIADALDNGGAAPKSHGAITIAGDTLVLKRLTIPINAGSSHPDYDLGAATGVAAPVGGAIYPTVEAVIRVPAFSTQNYYTDLTTVGGSLTTISAAIGTGAGFVITLTVKAYLAQMPEIQNIGGIAHYRLLYRMDYTAGSLLQIEYT